MSVYLECITGDNESRIMVKDNVTICPVCLKKGNEMKEKFKPKPAILIQMIENGYLLHYNGHQVHFSKLLDAWREISNIMETFNLEKSKTGIE